MKKLLKILIVEDVPTDAELLLHEITRSGLHFTSRIVETHEDYVSGLIDFKPDIILSDYSLPCFDGMKALMIQAGNCSHNSFYPGNRIYKQGNRR